MEKKARKIRIKRWQIYLLLAVLLMATLVLCVCVGSVMVSAKDILSALLGKETVSPTAKSIIMNVRLPRVLNVGLTGAALALCGAAMQGILRNPLADGSTLGVSSGASLGAVLAMAAGISIPGMKYAGTMVIAIVFAFASMLLILSLSYVMDHTLSTNSIILMGVIFSMFFSSLMQLAITFSGDRLRSITFWTMGSLSGTNFTHTIILSATLLACALVILSLSDEMNAFAMGEDNARHVGVNVGKVKLTVMAAVSVLIGVCVSIGGTIGFVGLVVPHMTRMVTGPNQKNVLPCSLVSGAIFLMLADLISRTIVSPLELPIGVVTSLVGAVVFVVIFYRSRKKKSEE